MKATEAKQLVDSQPALRGAINITDWWHTKLTSYSPGQVNVEYLRMLEGVGDGKPDWDK